MFLYFFYHLKFYFSCYGENAQCLLTNIMQNIFKMLFFFTSVRHEKPCCYRLRVLCWFFLAVFELRGCLW